MESDHRLSRWRKLRRAATRGLHLGLLLLSLLMLADPPVRIVGVVGLVLYFALVWHDALGAEPEGDEAGGEGEESLEASIGYRAELAAAAAARLRIDAAIGGADRALARILSPIRKQTDQVIERLRALVQRARRIDEFLARGNREEMCGSLAALEARIAATSDEFTRDQYLQAREARESQLRDYDELQVCAERVRAQITNVLTTLDAAEAKVIKLQAADLRHAGLVRDAVTGSLQALSQEMAGFQESIDATIALRAR
ncbi:MAG: hypothetical protein HY321_00575 [Armatimonadetes bacterium]|nr:hypothetical protein [Armatimonadota bacterium]